MRPLRRALPVIASVGLVLATGALGFLFTRRATGRAEQSHRQDRQTLQATLAGLGSQYQSFALKEELDATSVGGWSLNAGSADDQARLQNFVAHSALLGYGAALTDLNRQVLNAYTTGPGLPPPSDPGYSPMIAGLLSGQPGFSSVMHVGPVPVVAAAVPIMVKGRAAAVFVGYFRADQSSLQTYVENLHVGDGARSFVIDSQGDIIAAGTPALVGSRLPAPRVITLLSENRTGVVGYGSPGMVASYAPFRFGGWGSVTVQSATTFYGPLQSGQFHIEMALLAILFIAAGVIGIFAYKREAARRRFQEQLAYQASHDALTDLPNRTLFAERLAAALSRQRRHGGELAVLYLDLDGFKEVNDALGHDVGDALLVEIGQRLRHCVRAEDMVARMGGDEFTVLMEDVPDPGVTAGVCGRILELTADPVELTGQRLSVTASVGVALSRNGDAAVEDLLRDADLAMYRAKDSGGSQCVVFEDLIGRGGRIGMRAVHSDT